MSTNGAPLTAHEATIQTATVEIQVLKVGKKQVTVVLFRQLPLKDAWDPTTLAQLEAEARAAKRGLWAEAQPVPPWAWRKGQRAPPTTAAAPTAEPIIGNRRSTVYHWPGCPDYAKVSA